MSDILLQVPTAVFLWFSFSITDEEGLGNYSCVFDNQAEVDFILAGKYPVPEQVVRTHSMTLPKSHAWNIRHPDWSDVIRASSY